MPRRLLDSRREAFYHCVSRVVGRERCLKEGEKRYFSRWMRRLERFCGVQVVTYCLMENHFHLLVRVPCRDRMLKEQPLTEVRLRELLPLIYQGRDLRDALQELDRAAQSGTSEWMREILGRYSARRYSLSNFLKELKQRYTRWHNRNQERVGTLWEGRFRSVLVEGDETALLTVAAYIDLNPVRAGIVGDPKEYRWCGYAEAVAGDRAARSGMVAILERTSFGLNRSATWRTVGPRYRMLLYGQGEKRDADAVTGARGRRGMTREQVENVLERGGQLSVAEILCCRIRYLTEGMAIGSGDFIREVFAGNRQRFGQNRSVESAAKRMRGADWGGLRVLRGLRQDLFG